jgi:hypothetical protein
MPCRPAGPILEPSHCRTNGLVEPGTEDEPDGVLTGDSVAAMRDLTNAFARHIR